MTSGLNRDFVFGVMPGFWKKAYQSAVRTMKSTIELQRLTPSYTANEYELEMDSGRFWAHSLSLWLTRRKTVNQ
jgi:hypothetical protein